MDQRRSQELVICILDALHGKVCRIIQYGASRRTASETDIAILTPYKISADEEERLSDAVIEFNTRHRESVSAIDIDVHSYLKWKDSTPFCQEIDRTGILLWSGEESAE